MHGDKEALNQSALSPAAISSASTAPGSPMAAITAGVDFGIPLAGHWAGRGWSEIELMRSTATAAVWDYGFLDLADAETLAAGRAAMHQAMTGVSA